MVRPRHDAVAMDLSIRRRFKFVTVLAFVLAVESVGAVSVASNTGTAGQEAYVPPIAAPAGAVLGEESATKAPAVQPAAEPAAAVAPIAAATPAPTAAPARAAMPERAAKTTIVSSAPAPTAGSARPGTTTAAAGTKTATSATDYVGRNHVWIPALGINRSVAAFACDRSRAPDNLVYRWGCAGTNNVYLLGHAYSVFKPLHDAYVAGHLKVGMKAYYADSAGVVHTFLVKWWKTTRPTTSSHWAWDPQPVSSMTLQTCIGANSEFRLIVRLIEAQG